MMGDAKHGTKHRKRGKDKYARKEKIREVENCCLILSKTVEVQRDGSVVKQCAHCGETTVEEANHGS